MQRLFVPECQKQKRMRHIFLLITILFCLSCSRHKSNGCDADLYDYKVLSNSKIDTQVVYNSSYTVVMYHITRGDSLVFQYQHTKDLCKPAPPSASYTEYVVFELPANASSFSISNNEFKNVNAWYRRTCFCPVTTDRAIEQGSLEGHKLSGGSWHVQGTVSTPGGGFVSINADFPIQ
jgi:hypothetical protein